LKDSSLSASTWLLNGFTSSPGQFFAVLGLIILGLACWALWWFFFGSPRLRVGSAGWGLLAGLGYFVFVFGIWQPLKWRKLYRQHKDLHRPSKMLLTETEWKSEHSSGSGTIRWGDLVKWREGNSVFLLYPNDVLFYVLPKRLFPSPAQIDEFRQFLKGAITT
jgi:hypothetical protein